MGDNIYLGDRNGVRTPMQWSADRNAGFSRANPQKLYLPIIIDPEYHYEAINVEAQQNNLNSLLWWMKRLIGIRRQHRAFSRGRIEFLAPGQPPHPGLPADHRRGDDPRRRQPLRFVQYAELDLSGLRRVGSRRAVRRDPLSAGREVAVLPDARPALLLLVFAHAAEGRLRNGSRRNG